jgi:sugar/nucleoside kinase (ribokinase family)
MQKKGESQRTWDVIGFGENSVDLVASVTRLPPPDGKGCLDELITLPGGQIATAMAGCARLGLRAHYIGSFGSDLHGEIGKAALTGAGVDIARCRTTAAPTRTALILVETDRQSRIVLARRDDALNWPLERVPVDVVGEAKLLLVDATDLPASIAMAAAARSAGVTTMADVDQDVPGIDTLLQLVDILVVPAAFARDLRHLHQDSGARIVIATLGPDGAVAWDGTSEHYSPGFTVPVVDTTGAGDAFRAGLIAALLNPPSPRLRRASPVFPLDPWTFGPLDLDFANACAALNCQSVGAQTGLPTRAQVEAFVTSPSPVRSKGVWGAGHTVSQRRGESLSGEPE